MITNKQRESNREESRRWYSENREDYNILRRKRYAANKEVRIKARNRAATYRQTQSIFGVVPDRVIKRLLNGKVVVVLSTGQVAGKLGRTPQMIRNWESKGFIPPSVFSDDHRLYTKRQVRLLVTLLNAVQRNNGRWGSAAVMARIKHTYEKW